MCGAFYLFCEVWKVERIVKESVKNDHAHEVALELPLNNKKQKVLNALELPLNFVIFTPPTLCVYVVKI